MGSWLDERVDALRVAASSYVVTENIHKIEGKDGERALTRLRAYLFSLRDRFPDQEALLVLDATAHIVRAAAAEPAVCASPRKH